MDYNSNFNITGLYGLDRLKIIITDLVRLRMGDISKNFSRSEFACKCNCGFNTVDVELIKLLEVVRTYFKKPVTINSACRCEKHNINVGGALHSKHKLGIAADITVKDTKPQLVYNFINTHAPDKYGLGNYNTFTHVDVRGDKWRG